MDDAGGGLRGLRAAPSRELLDAVRQAYGVFGSTDPVDLGGSSNLNLLVRDGSDRWVVRAYRPYVTAARLQAIHLVRSELSERGVPCGGLLPSRDGQTWIAFENRLIEVERYVSRDADMDSWDRLEIGLPMLAQIHDVLRSVRVEEASERPLFANHIEPSEALNETLIGTRRIRAWDPSPEERRLADNTEDLARAVSEAEQPFVGLLPAQLVHGDYWDNNVFFRSGRPVFVTDFDFMGLRARIEDLALTFYFMCMEFPEDPSSDDRLRRLRGLLDAYDAGSEHPLSATERAAVPLAMARQPLWSIGGWVASLDDERTARQHAAATASAVEWALRIIREMPRWQGAFE
jgi:Ser/Thr protein kinase RdoA (MazF antagonist)